MESAQLSSSVYGRIVLETHSFWSITEDVSSFYVLGEMLDPYCLLICEVLDHFHAHFGQEPQ